MLGIDEIQYKNTLEYKLNELAKNKFNLYSEIKLCIELKIKIVLNNIIEFLILYKK